MRTSCPLPNNRGATTIAVVLVLCVVTLLILTATLQWASTNTRLTERNNQYQRSVAAAEAATEKAITKILSDFKKGGEKRVSDNMANYTTTAVPNYTEDPAVGSYAFNNVSGVAGSISVEQLATSQYKLLTSKYKGLSGYVTPFRVMANAKQNNTQFAITAAVRQDFELTTIPLFQFAIFYNIDMEMTPAPVMDVWGPVFCNENIYLKPQGSSVLTFYDNITSAKNIVLNAKPGDPEEPRTPGTLVFKAKHDSGATALVVPVGTNNTPAAVRQIVELPLAGEVADSELGNQRFYNKADLVIFVSNTVTKVTSGRVNNFATVVPVAQFDSKSNLAAGFLTRTNFTSAREGKTVNVIDIDVQKLKWWSGTNSYVRSVISNSEISIVYVYDFRTNSSTVETGVRVKNGTNLPPRGLTIATPNPLYVWGNYNCPAGALGTTNTSGSLPAALIGDAITVLSSTWKDANSGSSLSSRVAGDTTVNAAFLAGIVTTTNTGYSGGVENFPRFLEDWNANVFTYNGSMVVMFPSTYATAPWGGSGVYSAPDRHWAFDNNFRDMTKLPPGTPMSRSVVRSSWKMMIPNSTNVVASSP